MNVDTVRILALYLASLALAAMAPVRPAGAVTITVGSSGCQYIGLQFALDELESQAGPHVIKLRTQTLAIPNGLVLDTTTTSYTFIGGHASCADANPSAGQRTVLDAAGGNNGTAMAINGNSASVTPSVILRGVTVRGGSRETGIGANPEGGGLEVRGRILVQLNGATRIENNETGKGGGVYLRGDNAAEQAILHILGASEISENTADTTGGGIYCDQHGEVLHDNGLVSGNGADDGGGAFLRDTCAYDAQVQAGSVTGIRANFSIGSGGGLYAIGSRPLLLRGAQNAPFLIQGNVSTDLAGGLFKSNDNGRATATLENVVFRENSARRTASAAWFLGAVDAVIRPRSGSSTCAFAGVGLGACSAVIGNVMQQSAFNPGGALQISQSTAGNVPTLTIRNTVLLDNRSLTLLGAEGPGRFDIEGAVMRGNFLYPTKGDIGYPAALIWVDPDRFGPSPPGLLQRVRFSTIIDTSFAGSSPPVFDHGDSGLDVTGSIVHTPGLFSRSSESTGNVTHNGCLLVHDPAGYPTTPAPPIVAAPDLAADLAPNVASPALDRCNAALAPALDFRGNARAVDQPGVPNQFGPVDLGAIERPADPPPDAPNLQISLGGVIIPDGSTTPFVAGITDFGTVGIGNPLTRAFRVRNTSGATATLTFSAHNLSGACAGSFQLGALPTSLEPGEFVALDIAFDPVAAGECISTYQLFSNDPDNSPYDFQVRGLAVGDAILSNGFE